MMGGSSVPVALDLDHLSRQTMGDGELQKEVLSLFVNQLDAFERDIVQAPPARRRELLHGLKGAARGLGAFTIAEGAAALESDPADEDKLAVLLCSFEELRAIAASQIAGSPR